MDNGAHRTLVSAFSLLQRPAFAEQPSDAEQPTVRPPYAHAYAHAVRPPYAHADGLGRRVSYHTGFGAAKVACDAAWSHLNSSACGKVLASVPLVQCCAMRVGMGRTEGIAVRR